MNRFTRLITLFAITLLTITAHAFDFGGMIKDVVNETKERVVQEGLESTGEAIKGAFPSLSDGVLSVDSEQLGISGGGVVLYETDSCPYCVKARRYLQSNKVPYLSRNVGKSKAAQKELKLLGGRGVPVILVKDQRLTGWNQGKLQSMLKEAGYL